MTDIYMDDVPVSPYLGLSFPLSWIHVLFFASFLAPALYIAWCEAKARDLRADRGALWIGLPIALFTILLCLMTFQHFLPARIYLFVYGSSAMAVIGLRAWLGAATPPKDTLEEDADRADKAGTGELGGNAGSAAGSECRPRLVLADGDGPANQTGSTGLHWLFGSRYYQWTLRAEVESENRDGFVVVASASGCFIPWYGLKKRPVPLRPKRAWARIFCEERDGECAIDVFSHPVESRNGIYDEVVAITVAKDGNSANVHVKAVAAIEAKLLFEIDKIGGEAGGDIGLVKVGGKIEAKINRLNEGKSSVVVSRSYRYQCERN